MPPQPNVHKTLINLNTPKNNNNYSELLLCTLIIVIIGSIFILASVPPISRDALNHHLAIPKMYLQHGGIYEIPFINFSYFPMNIDLLYLLPLYFKNDIAAKYIHFFFALLTAWLIYKYLKQVLNKTYGLLGAAFFLSIPVIVKLSVTVYVDLGLIFFSWASLYMLIKWYDTHFSPKFLILSATACGLALGTKYNGLILIPIMGLIIPIIYSSEKNHDVPQNNIWLRYKNSFAGLGWVTVFILISIIFFSPWMARNIIWKQNPLYPLYQSVFNKPSNIQQPQPFPSSVEKEKPVPKNAFWIRRHVYKESFEETLLIPIRAFFQGKDDDPKYFDGQLNPFLLFFPLMAFVCGTPLPFVNFRKHRIIFTLFAVLFMLFVFFQVDFRIRYMSPAIPPLVILAVFGIKNIIDIVSKANKYIRNIGLAGIIFTILLAFAYNGNYIYELFNYIRPFDYLSGKVDRDDYISRFRSEHPVIVYANKTLPPNARVLCLSIGERTYYIDRAVVIAHDFYDKIEGRYSEKDILNKLKRYNTTHVIINRDTLFNWIRGLPKADQLIFLNIFKQYTKMLYEKNDVLLLSIEPILGS